MITQKPKVILTRKWPPRVEQKLSSRFEVELNHDDHPFTEKELLNALKNYDAICPSVTDNLDSSILKINDNIHRTKILANYGAGLDHIDLRAAKDAGICVTNTPDVLTSATAEITVTLMLMVARRVSEGANLIRAGLWSGWNPTQLLSTGVTGKTLGLVGMGRIGLRVAEIAGRGLKMRIQYFSRSEVSADRLHGLEVSKVSLEQLLCTSDFVSIHCAANESTFDLIGEKELNMMQSYSFLINTARGAIVNEKALAKAVKNNTIAGAGLDVYENEPAVNPALQKESNIILLPHMGSGTRETREAMGYKVLENLDAFFGGLTPPDLVPP